MRLPIAAAAQIQAILVSPESLSSSSSTSLSGSSATMEIDGPSTLLSCTPATFAWTPTLPPYTLFIKHHDAADSSSPTDDLVIVASGDTATWVVDLSPGEIVSVAIMDAEGNMAETEPSTVTRGSLDCLD
ncbi:hypothetical protein IAU60_004174 [Kwoniella sp. DSM 27419]